MTKENEEEFLKTPLYFSEKKYIVLFVKGLRILC